jgi:hypothetical protein
MSYDLLVFQPGKAPREREAFLSWWGKTAEWSEDHGYDDPNVSTPQLKAWFLEMIEPYPAMNGPFSSEELPEDDAAVTDYSVGKEAIYAAFAWSKAEAAYTQVFNLAAKHQLGFFDASSDTSAVWLPDGEGSLKLEHQGEASGEDDSGA